MAINTSLATMAAEAIDEYLIVSRECLNATKADGGCLGYPATLLLFCTVNALGTYLVGERIVIDGREQKITRREPFRVLNHSLFDLRLSDEKIKLLEKEYRNALAHNAVIGSGILVKTANASGVPFAFSDSLHGINVGAFHRVVANAWAEFPKERIDEWVKATESEKAAAMKRTREAEKKLRGN